MGQLVTTKDKGEAFKAMLEKHKPQIALALPKHMDAARFTRMALNAALSVPEILDCTGRSQIQALMAAATLGLEPGVAGECWILPFKDNQSGTMVATFIPGYRGLVQLCWRSDQIANIGAHAVYENDHFEHQKFPPKLVHRSTSGERGKLVGAYAYAKMKGGTDFQWEYLDESDIARIKKSSRGAKSKFSPWNIADFEPWMWKKSALRQLCKTIPMSVELRQAVDLDERADSGRAQNFEFDLDPKNEIPQATNGDAAAEASEDKKPEVQQKTEKERKQPAPAKNDAMFD